MPIAELAITEDFLGLPFAKLDMAEAVAAVKRASADDEWRYVVTPNAAHLARISKSDRILRDVYENAFLCLLDSRVVFIAARMCGLSPPRVVPGSDLVEELFRKAVTPRTAICVVGGGNLVAKRIREFFDVGEVYHIEPSIGFWRNNEQLDQTAAFVVASKADYTFLAVGSPQQEILAARVAAIGGARGVGICGGASIDFITGKKRRAPRFLQHLALEWAYRFCMEPRRLAYRYVVESPMGVLFVLRMAWSRK